MIEMYDLEDNYICTFNNYLECVKYFKTTRNMIWDFLIGEDIVALLNDEVEIIEEDNKTNVSSLIEQFMRETLKEMKKEK